MNILFVGMYPDEHNEYRNVFFRNLIYAMADCGVRCTVISPVPVTKYRKALLKVSKKRIDVTPKGNKVTVYHPRYISLSSKKILGIHTGILSENLFQKCAVHFSQQLTETYTAVYGHFFLSGGLAAIKIGKLKNIPSFVAYGECNYTTEIVNLFRELNYEDVDTLAGIISVSSHNESVLRTKKIFDNIPIIVAPNAVDVSLFYKREKNICREKLGLPQDKFIVGFVGGFIERKGDKRLLEAVEGLKDVYCAFAGRGAEPPSGEKVLFCHALNHDDVPIFLNAVDVFCLPTLNEGSCNALVEAASCGVPLISSDLPFNDDLLTDSNSIRIDPNSVDEIRSAIQSLYLNSALRNKLTKNIKTDAEKFTIEQRCNRILCFVREISCRAD